MSGTRRCCSSPSGSPRPGPRRRVAGTRWKSGAGSPSGAAGRARAVNRTSGPDAEPIPWLAALVCSSAFDLALHDAYGVLHGVPTYATYNANYMNADLLAIS